ncbi:transporter [Mycobacterium sp. D16Q16]|uniref:PH-like domain-containing protein n=1 Tax=Mycobacterium sp. D16Q16 TaxID=1855659 RepID=UPI000994140A|nr:transporter [Mycobacterium sp. D16Q16]
MNHGDFVGALIMAGASLTLSVLLFRLMWRGWRARAQRQADSVGELPAVPAERGDIVIEPADGLYVGSTIAPDWQDRIAVGDLGYRASATLTRYTGGVLLERSGTADIWIPADVITEIRTAKALAGKVLTHDGILAIRWRLPSGVEIDTGFLARPRSEYEEWKQAS